MMDKINSRGQALVSRVFKRSSNDSSMDAPPPYNDSRQYRSMRLLSTVALALLLLLSIPALALKTYSYSFIESNSGMGFYLVDAETQVPDARDILVAALPSNLFRVPEKLVLVVAMLNILLSMAHLAFVAWDWRCGRRTQTRSFRRNAMILHIFNVVLVLTALIAMFVSHKVSSTFDYTLIPKEPNAVTSSGFRYYSYDVGTFDLEHWTCELMKPKAVGDARNDYKAQCEIEVAGRTILVPFFLAALAVAGLSIWALIAGEQQAPRGEHIFTKDIDLEMMGKGPEADKQVQVEEVELATLQRSERQNDDRLSKIAEDEEEMDEVPKQRSTEAVVEENNTQSADTKDAKAKNAGGVS
ncbi:hypothetical protein C7974DRAFT_139343 [Boeremia exigua]|uniref:uncharacterized protein n=1 Tax=Boeremia exigua TaxID=749465 RepID=UPI001E8E2F34|nr:uncharacterized protein C7974DRAFT_139343 [Boeremia exigua]KAH6639819.1 hypothetical protein C7974DRAFT_139343 [Boeremia exigua]